MIGHSEEVEVGGSFYGAFSSLLGDEKGPVKPSTFFLVRDRFSTPQKEAGGFFCSEKSTFYGWSQSLDMQRKYVYKECQKMLKK